MNLQRRELPVEGEPPRRGWVLVAVAALSICVLGGVTVLMLRSDPLTHDSEETPMLQASEGRKPNRLAHETSPYLLQHANNPVDWYPWGDEALARAREDDKPVFLSVGYSTCHWCHVMAHESFEAKRSQGF